MKKFSKERVKEEVNEAKNKYYFFSILSIAAAFYLGFILDICVIRAHTIEYRNYCLFENNSIGIVISFVLIVVSFIGAKYFKNIYEMWKTTL